MKIIHIGTSWNPAKSTANCFSENYIWKDVCPSMEMVWPLCEQTAHQNNKYLSAPTFIVDIFCFINLNMFFLPLNNLIYINLTFFFIWSESLLYICLHIMHMVIFNYTWKVIGQGTWGIYPDSSSSGRNSVLKVDLQGLVEP